MEEAKNASAQTLANTNKWDTRTLVTMALLCAISVLVSFVELAIFAPAPYLKYDPSAAVAMICGFAYGPAAGFVIGVASAVIHGLIMGDPWGSIMTILVLAGFVVPAAALYKRKPTLARAGVGLAVGAVASVLCAIVGNLIITPIYNGMPLEAVVGLIVPVLLPFNILKAVLNAVVTLVVYKPISNLITPKKKQVVGR